MTFTLVVAVMAAAPVDVWLDVAADAPCVTAPALSTALTARGHRIVASAGNGLDVRVRGPLDRLTLEATRGERRFERTVPVTAGDCEAVSRVAVALVSSWASASPIPANNKTRANSDAGAPAPETTSAPPLVASPPQSSKSASSPSNGAAQKTNSTPSVVGPTPQRTNSPSAVNSEPQAGSSTATNSDSSKKTPASTSSSETGAAQTPDASKTTSATDAQTAVAPENESTGATQNADASRKEPSSTSRATGAHTAATPENENTGATQNTDASAKEPTTSDDAALTPRERGLSLEVIALAGVAHEPLPTSAPATTAQGHFGVRGAVGRWGLLLDGGFESGRTRTLGVATATASSQWLSLSFSVGFKPAARFSLDLALGVRGWRFAASATGVLDAVPQTFFTIGGVLSAGFNLQLVGPLQLQLRPWVSLRGSRGAFTVTNLGTVISIEPLAFGALLGAMLRFD